MSMVTVNHENDLADLSRVSHPVFVYWECPPQTYSDLFWVYFARPADDHEWGQLYNPDLTLFPSSGYRSYTAQAIVGFHEFLAQFGSELLLRYAFGLAWEIDPTVLLAGIALLRRGEDASALRKALAVAKDVEEFKMLAELLK